PAQFSSSQVYVQPPTDVPRPQCGSLCLGAPHRLLMSHAQHDMTVITPGTPIWLPQLDFLTNPCSSAAVVQAGVSMRRHNTPPRKLAGMPASSQCLTSPVTGCTKTAPPSPGPGSGTLDTQPEESVATRASKSRKTTVMALPAERDPGLSMCMLRLLAGQANDRAPPAERSRIRMPSASTRWLVVIGTAGLCSDPFPTGVTCSTWTRLMPMSLFTSVTCGRAPNRRPANTQEAAPQHEAAS